jgi:hypothetical protein
MNASIGRRDIPGMVIMAIIGIGLTILGSAKLNNDVKSKSWPVTEGTVTSSEVGGASKYYPSVNYTYKVDSAVYTSNRIKSVNFNTKNKSTVEEILKKYPVNATPDVYYNNEDPSAALLEPGINTGNILLLIFGIFLFAIPLFLIVLFKIKR